MTRAQLTLALQVLRGFGCSKTTYALLGLYALCAGLAWLVSLGIIQPDGTVDLRLWANGNILDIPRFNAWHWGAGVAILPLGFGFYARGVAKGPLLPVIQATAPDLAAVIQALATASVSADAPICEPQTETDRPAPIVLKPAGVVAASTLGGLGTGLLKSTGAE